MNVKFFRKEGGEYQMARVETKSIGDIIRMDNGRWKAYHNKTARICYTTSLGECKKWLLRVEANAKYGQ